MDIVYKETNINAMTDGSMASSSTTAMHHSAHLREKLEKLMQVPTMIETMDIDMEEIKKCTRMPQIHPN